MKIINILVWPLLNYIINKTKEKCYPEGYLEFTYNIDTIDAKIKSLCPHGSHREWDNFPIIETEGIKENHSYNNFKVYDTKDNYIIFEMEMSIDKFLKEKINNYNLRRLGFEKELTFEKQRFWIGEKAISRLDFFKILKKSGEIDYFNFKMEELMLMLI
ncbi:MAG: hypothetical protein H8D97_00880 [Proteobacteria bacterium]|nr:hypothetical protein [Pseudomonadota bacterium]